MDLEWARGVEGVWGGDGEVVRRLIDRRIKGRREREGRGTVR